MRATTGQHRTAAWRTRDALAAFAAGLLSVLPVQAEIADTVLARVEVVGSPATCPVEAQALLQDALGQDYLLVFTSRAFLTNLPQPHKILDAPAAAPGDYLLALPMRDGTRTLVQGRFNILHDDGRQLLLRATAEEAETLATLGFALHRLSPEPIRWSSPQLLRVPQGEPSGVLFTAPPDARVAALLPQVTATNLYWLLRRLTGEEAVLAGGGPFVISNRNTSGGLPISKACQFASERFQALGLATEFHHWAKSGYVNSNVVATQIGGALSNELVLVVAHLDNMPTAARAPGADDNASGCAAVLAAASLLCQFQFERTLRYVLFTGEEQGLLGSASYAALAATNQENIVGVVNLDMISWNTADSPPVLHLYTRTATTPGYTNDLAITSLFTNCVTAYALDHQLSPKIIASGMGYSDHAPFWNMGFPATLVIEEYGGDFTPYYHTTNDSIERVNWSYFTAAVRGALATAAHMASPAGTRQFGMLEVADGDWQSHSSLGAGVFRANWGVGNIGLDAFDVPWSNAPMPTHSAWFQAASSNNGVALQTDARPDDGDVRYPVQFTAVATNGASFTTTNRLRFELLTGAEPDHLYTARVALDPAFAGANGGVVCVTNLRQVLTQGGYIALPVLAGLTNGALYGTCEIAVRRLATNSVDIPIRLSLTETGLALVTQAQIGSRIADDLQTTDLLGGAWQSTGTVTNLVAPDIASFDSGWRELSYPLSDSGSLTNAERYFRIQRTWLPQ